MDNTQEHQSQQHAETAAQAAQSAAEQQAQQPTPEAALRHSRRFVDEQLSILVSSQAESAAAEQRLVELQADVDRAAEQRDRSQRHTANQVIGLHSACNESIGAIEALKAAYPLPAPAQVN